MEKRRDRKGRLQTIGRRITGPAWRFLAGTLAALILMAARCAQTDSGLYMQRPQMREKKKNRVQPVSFTPSPQS